MNQRTKRIFFQVFFILIACFGIEFFLRWKGYAPGDLKPNWLNFHPVDSLYVIHDFYTSDEGLLVADSNYWAEKNIYINSDGFRGKEFSQLDSTKQKILFVGDSFTWGMSASPFQDSSFCDLLKQETDYEIINTGIPATDPPQYAAVAEKYIPRLKPDFVFVVFFMGNDLMKEDRAIIPGEPFYYYTNAGAILADVDGKHFKSAQEAYNYITTEKYYLHKPSGVFEKIISQSSILSRLYSVKFRMEEKWLYEETVKHPDITLRYLKKILNVAKSNNTSVSFLIIPEIKEADMSVEEYGKKYAALLADSSVKTYWLIPQNEKSYFNDYPDAHLNNKGHRTYADYLKEFLRDYFKGE